jgi:hypothetical membrane protein
MSDESNRTSKRFHIAGISGILSSTVPLIMILASTVLEKTFSWSRNALSDLGVSQTAWLFNSALIVGGLLNLLFAFGLRSYLRKAKRLKIGVSLLIVSSISLAFFSIIHGVVALGYLLFAPLGLLFIGLEAKSHGLAKVSLVFGILALMSLFFVPVIVFSLNLQVGFAVPEFLETLLLSIWTFFVSVKLLFG